MDQLKASLLNGSTWRSDPLTKQLNIAGSAWTTATSVNECRSMIQPNGKVILSIEPGIVNDKARVTSLAYAMYQNAVQLGILSDKIIMTKRAIKLSDTNKVDSHLRTFATYIKNGTQPDIRACDGILIDYCIWQDASRHELGAPTANIYEWIKDRMTVFANALGQYRKEVYLNSYGDSLTQPWIPFHTYIQPNFKAESFWNIPSNRYGTGFTRFKTQFNLIVERLKAGSDVMFNVAPRNEFSDDTLKEFVVACAMTFKAIQFVANTNATGEVGKLYWFCDKLFEGQDLDYSIWPRVNTWLNKNEVTSVSMTDDTLIVNGNKQITIPSTATYRDPFRIESI